MDYRLEVSDGTPPPALGPVRVDLAARPAPAGPAQPRRRRLRLGRDPSRRHHRRRPCPALAVRRRRAGRGRRTRARGVAALRVRGDQHRRVLPQRGQDRRRGPDRVRRGLLRAHRDGVGRRAAGEGRPGGAGHRRHLRRHQGVAGAGPDENNDDWTAIDPRLALPDGRVLRPTLSCAGAGEARTTTRACPAPDTRIGFSDANLVYFLATFEVPDDAFDSVLHRVEHLGGRRRRAHGGRHRRRPVGHPDARRRQLRSRYHRVRERRREDAWRVRRRCPGDRCRIRGRDPDGDTRRRGGHAAAPDVVGGARARLARDRADRRGRARQQPHP